MIRHGYSRTVLLIGPWAVKVPSVRGYRRFLWGLLSNLAEAARRQTPGAAPVLLRLPLGLAVVQPRCDPVPDGVPIPAHVRALAGYDDKACSYGLHRGEVVALDYHGDVAEPRALAA